MNDFKSGWPHSFHNKIPKGAITMDIQKKHISVGEHKVYDQELIYARVIGLLTSGREIDFNSILSTELAAYPPSMFDEHGLMRSAQKSEQKRNLQVLVSERAIVPVDTTVVDVSALLWTLNWPTDTLGTYVKTFVSYVTHVLQFCNAVFVFDRYFDESESPKSYLRSVRQKKQGTSRVHLLSEDIPAPSRQVVLGVTKNKIQLNKILADALMGLPYEATLNHTLTIAGVEDIPTEINHGEKIRRVDLKSKQEEADGIVVQHAIMDAIQGKNVRVVPKDTDVFV